MRITDVRENAIAHYDHGCEYKQWLVKKIHRQMLFMETKENVNVEHERKCKCEQWMQKQLWLQLNM